MYPNLMSRCHLIGFYAVYFTNWRKVLSKIRNLWHDCLPFVPTGYMGKLVHSYQIKCHHILVHKKFNFFWWFHNIKQLPSLERNVCIGFRDGAFFPVIRFEEPSCCSLFLEHSP